MEPRYTQALLGAINKFPGAVSVRPSNPANLLIIFSGESNSGGFAPNSQAPVSELGLRPNVRILNNSFLKFEPLDIGVNSLIDHAGLSGVYSNIHGFELGLANEADAGKLGRDPIYLVKTGQGGSTIQSWGVGDTYYTKFLARTRAARAVFTAAKTTVLPILWYTQGINDAFYNSITVSEWKTLTLAHFAKIRQEIPDLIILFAEITPKWGVYNQAIAEVVAATSNCYLIKNTNATVLPDLNHWDYFGAKLIASRFVDKTAELIQNATSSTAFL
jgi:hypothetical protein